MQSRVPLWLVLTISLVIMLVAGASLPVFAADEKGSAQEIENLIRQLRDQDFDRREEASRRLRGREDAIPALRKAAESGDAETARRASELLDLYARRHFDRLTALAKAGRVDEAVEKLVRQTKWDDERACWQVMAELAGMLLDREQKNFGWASLPDDATTLARDVRRFEAARPRRRSLHMISEARALDRKNAGDGCLVRVEEMTTESGWSWDCSFLAVPGEVRIGGLSRSILFSGGSVRSKDAFKALIVCDGDCYLEDGARDSLIIARGDVRIGGSPYCCHIVSGGKVRYDRPAAVDQTKAKENEPNPLGFVKFFDPAKIGIKVEFTDGGVRIKEVEKGKAFAVAGLRAGDRIVSLDGDAVKDPEQFRRLLRAKLTDVGEAAFRVRRDDKDLDIPVKHKD